MLEKGNNLPGLLIKAVVGLIMLLVVFWVFFTVILPTVKFVLTVVISLSILGALLWVAYKVLTFNIPEKRL
jgi:hypothetical protein